MPRYRITNLITKEKAEIEAILSSDACQQLGWPLNSCRVELMPVQEPTGMQTRGGRQIRSGIIDEDSSSDQRRLLVLMVLLGALIGGISGVGSGIVVVGAIFGAFIGAGLALIMWGMLGPSAIPVVNTILMIALVAAAVGWVIKIVYKSSGL
ncbi:hypothetical protein J7M28_11655 [bacterium]|nr:hypothetical protein [bacterium]